ncbi:uncharacterized protein N7443_004632 [Penicillium atrosanguineum]|uniref:uncharacterized protein n=1 Tax=Penicillium atrosanguineum TaxID=1132637 RepID=UPI00238C4097|nr:uncharacterized protein N7443_004632 [Penicillium atrosanguineum]KAJ5304972.1 hypothetical protein N7443_004632 [Penicillium atrosanguineum]
MPSKTIFLMGAPLSGQLDWDNDELFDKPTPPFHGSQNTEENQLLTNERSVKWRVLQPLENEQPNVHQSFYYGPDDPNFLTTHQLKTLEDASTPEDESILFQFYDHSFAVHEASEISISRLSDDSTQETEPRDEKQPATTLPEEEIFESSSPMRIPGVLSNLEDLPTAKHLQSITPQTKTVNLIVGIIAIHPPRRIVTRQWKKELDLIELVVGDETKTGFGVNFWLPAEKPAKTQEIDRLGQTLAALRPRDIVLLRTVGLSTFQDRVYGQSLRGMTQINLVHRWPADMTDAGGHRAQRGNREKLNRVREWVLRFVGTDTAGSMSGMPETQRGQLPPDTQE